MKEKTYLPAGRASAKFKNAKTFLTFALLFCVSRFTLYALGMPLFEVIILALIQGLTEFLPVSSSGHLLAARYLFGFEMSNSLAVDGFLHVGTLAAVLLYYWKTWGRMLESVVRWHEAGQEYRRLAGLLVVATIPGALAGYYLKDHAWFLVSSPHRLAGELLITALCLGIADHLARRFIKEKISLPDAIWIGLAQVLALAPGISRSGITIAAGRARGLTREAAVNFSFLMSAPIIAGAGGASLAEILATHALSWPVMLIAFIVSFVSGLAAIHLLLKIVKRTSFTLFIVYLIILAAVLWMKG